MNKTLPLIKRGLILNAFIHVRANVYCFTKSLVLSWKVQSLSIPGGLVPGPPTNTEIQGCSSPLNEMAYYWHVTYAHPFVYFKSSLDYL